MTRRFFTIALALFSIPALAEKECWALSEIKGQAAFSEEGYKFAADGFSNPMILCFDKETNTGTVSGDDTALGMFGTSTLAGWGSNRKIELFEVYQIDRGAGKVLFTKSRIGTSSLIPGGTDLVGAYVGKAVKLK